MKFTDYLATSGKQPDRDIAALASRYPAANYDNAAKKVIAGLINQGSIDPGPGEIDTTYKRAEQEYKANKDDIVDDWDGAESRFLSLIRRYGAGGEEVNKYVEAYRKKAEDVLIACAHIKVKCDAARPWQYTPTQQPPLVPPIIDRWDSVLQGSKVCELPMHAAFPSAHSCVAYVQVKVIKERFGLRLLREAEQIADDIGTRRIIAGVHFQRDIAAAKTLVDAILP